VRDSRGRRPPARGPSRGERSRDQPRRSSGLPGISGTRRIGLRRPPVRSFTESRGTPPAPKSRPSTCFEAGLHGTPTSPSTARSDDEGPLGRRPGPYRRSDGIPRDAGPRLGLMHYLAQRRAHRQQSRCGPPHRRRQGLSPPQRARRSTSRAARTRVMLTHRAIQMLHRSKRHA